MKSELSNQAFTACHQAATRIIEHHGVPDQQKSNKACRIGDLNFERTNTGHTEVRVNGQLVFSVPLLGSRDPVIWQPGDWLAEVHKIHRLIES